VQAVFDHLLAKVCGGSVVDRALSGGPLINVATEGLAGIPGPHSYLRHEA
jgi:hypothetical protein